MRIVITRPQPAAERTAAALRARGHDVLVAPLMNIENIPADLSGNWAGIVITSANAPGAVDRIGALLALPLFAVGERSAEAAREAGFKNVTSADGAAGDLVKLLAAHKAKGPMLYLAGEDRAADLVGDLAKRGIKADMRVVYRAVTAPFPSALVAAVESGDIEAVLHFSARSAENYLASATDAGVLEQALEPRQLCLSAQVATPLKAAGAANVTVSPRPDEASLIELTGHA